MNSSFQILGLFHSHHFNQVECFFSIFIHCCLESPFILFLSPLLYYTHAAKKLLNEFENFF
nr:MAG TPA: hypothetical protein [Caudoviricetes sp.]